MAREFHRHARTVTLLTLVSRLGGLARDAAMSRVFGAGLLMDAFAFAFLVPNLFRRLFGEGALSAAFLPEYTRWSDRDSEVAQRLAWIVIGGATAVVAGLALLAGLAAAAVAATGRMDPLAARLLLIMLPFAPLICLTALLGAMLQAHHRFGPTAAAPIVLNLLLVSAAIAATGVGPEEGITLAAAAVLLAGVIQVLWSMAAMRRAAVLSRGTSRPEARDAARRVAKLALPMIVGLGVLQLNTLLDGLIASWPSLHGPTIFGLEYPLAEGSMARLSWAQRLYEFPLGVFGIAVATAIFPALSRIAGDDAAFIATLRRGVRLVFFIGLPASVGLMLVAMPLTATILQGRSFTAEDSRETAWILLGYAPAVWAYSLNQVLVRGFYAKSDSMAPVRIAMSLVALNLALNLLLIWTPLRTAGLAWSTALCAVLQSLWLLKSLSARLKSSGQDDGIVDRSVRASAWRSVAVTAVMTVVVLAVAAMLPEPSAEGGWWGALATLLVLVSTGGAAVFAVARLLKMPEWSWALGRQRDE